MPRGILLYHILNIVRFKSFSELLTCHKILQLRARQWINTIRNRETHHKPHQCRDITQNKRNYVSAHNKETCMSLLAVFMFLCANNERFNHIHVQIYIKKFKAELNKTKDCIFSCNIKEGTHMLLVRDARSSVTCAPIARKPTNLWRR